MAFTPYQHVEIAACPIDGIVQQYKNSNNITSSLSSSVLPTLTYSVKRLAS
jgi:hypothetical protein